MILGKSECFGYAIDPEANKIDIERFESLFYLLEKLHQAKAFSFLSAGKGYSPNLGFTSELSNGSSIKTGAKVILLDVETLQKSQSVVTL